MAPIVASNRGRAGGAAAGAGRAGYTARVRISSARARALGALLWLTAAGLGAAWPAAQPAAVLGDRVAIASRPYAGVVLTVDTDWAPRPVRLHVAQIDLRAPGVRVMVTGAGGSREAVRETTLEALRRTGAQLAVNGHFFLPFPSDDADAWVVGLAASEGRVFSPFEAPEQSFALVADAPALVFDRRQRARIAARRPGGDGRHVRGRGQIWNAVAGSAQIVTGGRVTIPRYRDAAFRREALVPGPDGRYDNGRSWYDVATARTVAGLSKDRRTLTLVTADVRGGSEGIAVGELARRLVRDYGVWDALNLDGGGSTTMAWRDPATGRPGLLNTPSDPAPEGRRVATSVLVFAAPTRGTGGS